jgi:predicted nuclease of predicted toxin-antitoxin system
MLWLTLGNSSNQRLQRSLERAWSTMDRLLRAGEPTVRSMD